MTGPMSHISPSPKTVETSKPDSLDFPSNLFRCDLFRGLMKMIPHKMGRAFSPHRNHRTMNTWADGPGWYGFGPLALQTRQAFQDADVRDFHASLVFRANGAFLYQPGASPQDNRP